MKLLYWLGNARDRLREFPDAVKGGIGYALYVDQRGEKHPSAKALKGFGAQAFSK